MTLVVEPNINFQPFEDITDTSLTPLILIDCEGYIHEISNNCNYGLGIKRE
jgi:hypothetical protein